MFFFSIDFLLYTEFFGGVGFKYFCLHFAFNFEGLLCILFPTCIFYSCYVHFSLHFFLVGEYSLQVGGLCTWKYSSSVVLCSLDNNVV